MKKIISFILSACMLMSFTTAFAEKSLNSKTASVIIDTEALTEENVIYNAMQNNHSGGISLFGLNSSNDDITAAFDVVLGFDMSSAMYSFDYNGEMTWLDNFTVLSEQVPDSTRFAVVTKEEGEFTEDLDAAVESIGSYSGESDITELLDNCLNTFDSTDRNNIVIATAATVTDTEELEDKLDELRNYGVIPFVFVLNTETSSDLDDIDGVYQCASELELRLAISDLYLSFAEFNNVGSTSEIAVMSADISSETIETSDTSVSGASAIVGNGSSYKTDFRTGKHNYKFSASNEITSFGMAITSILNIYSCLPLQAETTSDSYDLMSGTLSETMFDMLKNVCTGYTNKISESDTVKKMIEFWGGLKSTLNSSITSISTSSSGYIIDSSAQTRIIESVKRRFPVLLKIGSASYVITEYKASDNSIELSAIDYTQKYDEQKTTLAFNISGNNWVLPSSIDDLEEYNTMVFDMYSYINSYATAYNITDSKTEYNGHLKIEFNIGSMSKNINGIVKDEYGTIVSAEF